MWQTTCSAIMHTGFKFKQYCRSDVEHHLLCFVACVLLSCPWLDISLPCACSNTTVLNLTCTVWLLLRSIRKQSGRVVGADGVLT